MGGGIKEGFETLEPKLLLIDILALQHRFFFWIFFVLFLFLLFFVYLFIYLFIYLYLFIFRVLQFRTTKGKLEREFTQRTLGRGLGKWKKEKEKREKREKRKKKRKKREKKR